MSLDAIRWAWSKQGLRPIQKLVLMSLADRADGNTNYAWPSQAQLEFDTGADLKTIKSALKHLAEIGLISDTGKRSGHTKQIIVWEMVGVTNREAENQSQNRDQYQDRNKSENGRVPKTEGFRFSHETSPKTEGKGAQKRTTEPTNEPIKNHIGDTKKKTSLNDDSVLPPAWKEKGKVYGMTEATIENEFGKFKNHHLEKKTRSENWIRQWDTWCRGWVTYGAKQVQSRTINLASQQTSYWN